MAAPYGPPGPALIDDLTDEACRFDFFQAVRLIARYHQQRSEQDPSEFRLPVGHDAPPGREDVRFRSIASFSFPSSAVGAVDLGGGADPQTGRGATPELHVAFLGLIGPSGVLPDHYTRLICDRLREGDTALHEFLDLFHHRLLSLFYRAWEKYRVPFGYETGQLRGGGEDRFSSSLFSLIGLGSKHARRRLSVADQALLFYAGHFSDSTRPAGGLEAVLADYFNVPVGVLQYQGQWLYLNDDDLTRLTAGDAHSGGGARGYCVLGQDFVAGSRVWDVQSKFRIQLGPLDYRQFLRLLPTGTDSAHLLELTRLYAGVEFDFDVQPILKAEERPALRLVSDGEESPRLGWNTWCFGQRPSGDANEVILSITQQEQPPQQTRAAA